MDTNTNGPVLEGTGAVAAAEAIVPEATLYESPFAPIEEEKPNKMLTDIWDIDDMLDNV